MANFNTAFGLCSTTDSRGLLGVAEDDDGCVVVTLGKSMIIRCRLSDQKQLNSWSTALAKLTSKVVWNAIDENYVGVFDNVYIKQWTKVDSSLEKAKKHKFKNEIHELLLYSKDNILRKSKLIVLFKNGSIRDLESALSSCKDSTPDVIQPQEIIELADIIFDGVRRHLIIVTKYENKYRQCYCASLEDGNFLIGEPIKKTKLRRPGTSLLGFTILAGEKGNSVLTFWSDGFLYSLPLPLESEKCGVGKYLGAINVISKTSEVAIQAVGHDHIAIYGGDISEEGAFLGIYNVKFGVIQAQASFKMFNKPPRMWLIDNNLVIVMGQRLVCVPFNLQTQTLSALVGSRALHSHLQTPSEICTIVPTAVWDENGMDVKPPAVDYPDKIKEQLITFSSEGWSEFGICQALMGQLIESKDIDTLLWCLNNFSDIPEDHLVRMIQLALRDRKNEIFKSGDEEDLKSKFLNKILSIPVDSFSLLTNLKRLFDFDDCLALVGYLTGLLSNAGVEDVSVADSTAVLEWTMTLLDAFYQYFILSKDPKVLESVATMKEQVEELVVALNDMAKIIPYVTGLQKGKSVGKKRCGGSYSVERFRLYT
ncbi:hypothetical protein RUM44_002976 [Polyplax serrata]|uniref:Nucleolar protein 11 n=1 Tax=Polyplax serrata TaxID=468196 RepID=A0ABR1AXC6_POLSC